MANVLYPRTFTVKPKVRPTRNVLCSHIDQSYFSLDVRGMKLNIGRILRQRGITQTALADAVGVQKGYMSELVSGKKDPSFEVFTKLIEVLDVDPTTLLGAERSIAIAGRVGAGANVELVDAFAKGDGLFHIVCPDDLPAEKIVGVEVQGDSMWPLIQEGDVLLFSRNFIGVDPAAVDNVAIIETEDGRALVKEIRKGRDPATFDVYSFNTATNGPEYGLRLKWAAPYRRHLRQQDVERI